MDKPLAKQPIGKLAQELQDIRKLQLCAEQCGVVGDMTKLTICYLLRYHDELSVSEIAELANTSISNVSHSLAKLKKAQLVIARRQSQQIFYSLKENAFHNILAVIGGISAKENAAVSAEGKG